MHGHYLAQFETNAQDPHAHAQEHTLHNRVTLHMGESLVILRHGCA